MLNQPPADLFGGPSYITGSSGRSRAAATPTPAADHLIYNPPPSAPNVYHTPLKFLPKTDIRQRLAQASISPSTSSSRPTPTSSPSSTVWPTNTTLPPRLFNNFQEKKYHLTPTDFTEMRKLRAEDPTKWTRSRLAERFQCTSLFVSRVTGDSVTVEYKREARREHGEARAKWGKRRREAREDRERRKEAWGRDE